ncbi:hypothetical protein Btru_070119 [Bulinus truncatus]|nr:hypothetical protein Btru_070119 [Bulinus truncatus]
MIACRLGYSDRVGNKLVAAVDVGHGWAISEAVSEIILPEHVNFCYFITGVYVVSHAIWVGVRAPSKPLIYVADTFLFDGFATVILPTILTASVYRLCRRALKGIAPQNIAVYISTGASMFCLMSLWTYIDELIDHVLETTVRVGEGLV